MKFTMFKILFFFTAMFVVGGCAAPRRAPVRVCTGAESVKDAISGLRSWSSGATSFRGNGRCVFQYRERAGIRRESFPVKLWVNPPTEVRLQGDVAFDPKAVVLVQIRTSSGYQSSRSKSVTLITGACGRRRASLKI